MQPSLPSVLVAEDDEGAGILLEMILRDLGYPFVGRAADGVKAVEMTLSLKPDVLLLDIGMPMLDGIEAARRILEEMLLPIVVLTGRSDDETLEKVRLLGVQAFLLKPLPSKEQLHAAIGIAITACERQRANATRIGQINSMLESARTRKVPRGLGSFGLTERETEILNLVAEGRTNSEIGTVVNLSTRTVEKHVEHILGKLGVKSRAAAARLAADATRYTRP
jgi:DNA-binding NarL/FixJ family response regulator